MGKHCDPDEQQDALIPSRILVALKALVVSAPYSSFSEGVSSRELFEWLDATEKWSTNG